MNKSPRHRDTAADTRARETRAEANCVWLCVDDIWERKQQRFFPISHGLCKARPEQ